MLVVLILVAVVTLILATAATWHVLTERRRARWRKDRVRVARELTEAQIDRLTRQTLQAMRDAAREQMRRSSGRA